MVEVGLRQPSIRDRDLDYWCLLRNFNLSTSAVEHGPCKCAFPFVTSLQPVTADQAKKVVTSFSDAMKLAVAALQDIDQNATGSTAFNQYSYPGQQAQAKAAVKWFFSLPNSGKLWNPIFSNTFISIGAENSDVDLA